MKSGHAFGYRQYLNKCDRLAYLSLEMQAQQNGLGIWSLGKKGIKRPWVYRNEPWKGSNGGSAKKKYRCKEIKTWETAQKLLKEGHAYLDRDGNACESLR